MTDMDALAHKFELTAATRIFLIELCNSAAVKCEAATRGGDEDKYARGVMRSAAIALSLHFGISTEEVEWEAKQRALQIFSQGQDYHRELQLFSTLVEFNRR
jgi:hypothetical protein